MNSFSGARCRTSGRLMRAGLFYLLIVTLNGFLFLAGPANPARAAGPQVNTCDDTGLRTAVTNANSGDTITFGCSGTIALSARINLGKRLTLDGSGQSVTIDGGHTVGLFDTGGFDATFKNLTLINGNAGTYGNGGAINSYPGNLTLTNVTLAGNTGYQGGAVYSSYGSVTVTNSVFNNNTATADYRSGGAIYIDNGGSSLGYSFLNISGGTFQGNTATASSSGGGAIYYNVPATITGSSFIGNSAQNSGGGIYVMNPGTLSVTGGLFDGNSASQGGAVYVSNIPTVTITGTTFQNNTASMGAGVNLYRPGSATLSNLNVSNNTASMSGAGIYSNWTTVTINDSNFTGNKTTATGAGSTGGAALFNAYASHITVNRSAFSNNIALANSIGGAIHNYNNDSGVGVTVNDSTFDGNQAGSGGAIASEQAGSIIAVYRSTFTGNQATGSGGGTGWGGAIDSEFASGAYIENSTFYNNSATFSAGAIIDYSSSSGITTVKSSSFLNNTASNYGTSVRQVTLYNSVVSGSGNNSCYGVTDNGGNLQYNSSNPADNSCGPAVPVADPKLAPPASNGGLTPTMALQPGSAALDSASKANCLPGDQIGTPRQQPGSDPTCDIGALESSLLPPGPSVTPGFNVPNIPVGGTATLTYTIVNYPLLQSVSFNGNLAPSGLDIQSVSTDCPGAVVSQVSGQLFSFAAGTFGPFVNCKITVQVLGSVAGSYTASGNLPTAANPAVTGSMGSATLLVGKPTPTVALVSSINPSQAGQAVTFTATVTTGSGTPTGTVTFMDGATPLGTAPLGGNQAGFSTSGLSLGSHTITAIYNGDSNYNGATSAALTQVVTTGPASQLVVAGFPASVVAGSANSITVTVKDASGNIVTNYNGTIHFSSSDAQAVLPADYTFVAGDNGTHTFNNVVLKTAGNAHSITATDTNSPTLSGSQTGITVTSAAAATVVITGGNNQATAVNTPFGSALQVHVQDIYGNPVPGVAVTFSAPAGGASASLNISPVNTSSAGDASVTAKANTVAGSYSVSAVAAGVATPVTFSLTNQAGTATTITAVSGDNQSATVNTAFGTQLQVKVSDSYGNPVAADNVTFTAPSTGASALFSNSSNTFSALTGSDGIATASTFSANATAGSYSVDATSAAVGASPVKFNLTNLPGTAANIAVNGGDPQSAQVGTAFAGPLQVKVTDSHGNPVSGVTVNFSVPATGASAGLNSATATTDGSGLAGVKATANSTSGSYSVTASANGIATQAIFSLTNTPGSVTHFSVTYSGGATTAGTPITITVTALDASNNVVTGYSGTVHFTSSDIQAVLPADYTFVAADKGSAQFSVTLKTAGTQTVTVTDTTDSSLQGSVTGLVVNPAGAASLQVSGYPVSVAPGSSNNFTVKVLDIYGNLSPGYAGTVHFGSSDPQAVLPADYTFVAADNGAHTFSATFKTTGLQSISATDTVTASISGSQSGINVGVANGSQISPVAGSGQSVTVNQPFPLQLQAVVKDAFGNPVQGEIVTFMAPGSGASATFPNGNTATTGPNGIAAISVVANGLAGSYTINATIPGAINPASFSLSNCDPAGCTATDIALSLTSDKASSEVGQSLTLTLTLTNRGSLDASNLQATVKLPDGLQYLSSVVSGGTAYDAASGIWKAGNLAGGASLKLTISVKVLKEGRFEVFASKTQAEPDSDTSNDSASVTIAVGKQELLPADLVAKLRVSPDRLALTGVANSVKYTLTVKNIGPGKAELPAIKFPLDKNLEVGYASFSDQRAWVREVVKEGPQPYMLLSLPGLASYESQTVTLYFTPLAAPEGTVVITRYSVGWDDDVAAGKQVISNAVRFSLSGSGPSVDVSGGAVQTFDPGHIQLAKGASLKVNGDFYAPNEKVEFWYTDADNKSLSLGYFWVDAQGQVIFEYDTADLKLETGKTYSLSGKGLRSEITGNAAFEVK
ncbi:MAG TPA: Ig-like domain-containing protein [Chloroflexia bacterium]|nr:Ig-like domain-containing protein [Chloroflexia bacterium]